MSVESSAAVDLSIRVRMSDFDSWTKEQIAAFMAGIAAVRSASWPDQHEVKQEEK